MYTQEGNYLKYFTPNIQLAQNAAEVLKAIDIGASSGDHGEVICVLPCMIKRLQFTLTEELAGGTSAAPTVIFTKRPTPLSATNEVVIDTLVIPDATAIGKTVYVDVDPVEMLVGDSVEISWTVGTGTPTGIGIWSMICEDHPEYAGNQSDMIASA